MHLATNGDFMFTWRECAIEKKTENLYEMQTLREIVRTEPHPLNYMYGNHERNLWQRQSCLVAVYPWFHQIYFHLYWNESASAIHLILSNIHIYIRYTLHFICDAHLNSHLHLLLSLYPYLYGIYCTCIYISYIFAATSTFTFPVSHYRPIYCTFISTSLVNYKVKMGVGPLVVEVMVTFMLAAGVLFRYGNWYRHHLLVTVAVLIAWYFSMLIVFILPLDVSNVSVIYYFSFCQLI